MSQHVFLTLACPVLVLLTACADSQRPLPPTATEESTPGRIAGWDAREAVSAEKLELQLDDLGQPIELEYHIAPGDVPPAVRDAMDALHPGGEFIGAEKEWSGGEVYYELTREVEGMEVEAMFRPDGGLYQEELEVGEDRVPDPVREAARNALSEAVVDKWEEIRDGSRTLQEYHVKMSRAGQRFKVRVDPSGNLLGTLREIPAEIEVALP
jgi:hypothetical protein